MKYLFPRLLALLLGVACLIPNSASAYYYHGRHYRYRYHSGYYRYHHNQHYYRHRAWISSGRGYYRYW